ncbi:MAG: hypothetical protein IJ829_01390, partial [Kiritimatiellae bacterium]|nr:hypothetical protein [Kiritimatiellia bacterium]
GRLGHAVRVGCRVLSRPGDSLARGVDFEAWARSGWIDLLVPCNFFGSVDFNLPYAEWRRRVDACSRRGGRRVVVVPGLDNGLVENGRRRRLTLAEYAVFADRMYRQGAPGVYLFNAFDNDGEVYSSLVGEGLPPDLCAERAKGVAVPDGYD